MKTRKIAGVVAGLASVALSVVAGIGFARSASGQAPRQAWPATPDEVRDMERVSSIRIQASMLQQQVYQRVYSRTHSTAPTLDYDATTCEFYVPTGVAVPVPAKPEPAKVDSASK